MKECSYKLYSLGQVGFRFEYKKNVILFDPYLSNSVQERESKDLARLLPIPIQPESITDASLVAITHTHRDHCDIETLLPICSASSACRVIAPYNVVNKLKRVGVDEKRLIVAECGGMHRVGDDLTLHPVPAAHPTLQCNENGLYRVIGYVIKIANKTFYHAGDTSPHKEIIDLVREHREIDIAFLPVNERNYFLDFRGIIGNMSIREAFQFAEEIGTKVLVPTHWDMFEVNSVFKEEIEFLYKKISPNFKLEFFPYYVG